MISLLLKQNKIKNTIQHKKNKTQTSTRILFLATPDEIVEHVANQRVFQCPEVTKNCSIAVHQCPGFTPEEELRKKGKYKAG